MIGHVHARLQPKSSAFAARLASREKGYSGVLFFSRGCIPKKSADAMKLQSDDVYETRGYSVGEKFILLRRY